MAKVSTELFIQIVSAGLIAAMSGIAYGFLWMGEINEKVQSNSARLKEVAPVIQDIQKVTIQNSTKLDLLIQGLPSTQSGITRPPESE